ncbi:MAG: hypothetical protein Unbinned200contig1000_54 [Prokaryotic dsDNA virus sp.]|nr:hypothetical protein [Flavobacteriaceae bacterium]QDP65314.1 MAG: hypothetical protein Unbinned200contig1000_54 [Prokaryotic dsDNA virus sp.]
MFSNFWIIPWSVKGNDQYQSSFVMFEEQVTKSYAENNPDKGRVLFETVDLTPEEEASILQAMRFVFI